MSEEKVSSLPKSIDLSHHLSNLAKSRNVSPLKDLQKYIQRPGLIQMAGGLPDPTLFPIETLHIDALVSNSFAKKNAKSSSFFGWIWSMFGGAPAPKTETYTVNKFAATPEEIDMAHALQYSSAGGTTQLQAFFREFTQKVYTPAYADWITLAHCGNTDGTTRCFATFCNPGDSVVVEEWTYPSALSTARPMGIKMVPVKVDGQGMAAVDLERVLSTWDENVQGRRPRVMYTVPIGQNPTGATMGTERKLAIYDICVRYGTLFLFINFSLSTFSSSEKSDMLIIEDDPYYFLQEGTYVPKSLRAKMQSQNEDDPMVFLNSLTPSYLKFDYQGRVIRLDSFSKIIAPGSRMGWFTCNPLFAERLERHGETNTQAPCGFSQSIIVQLITKQWGMKKFIRWLQGLQGEYTSRRDFMVDTLYELFDVAPATGEAAAFGAGLPVMTAYLKEPTNTITSISEKYKAVASKTPLFSFIPPTAGMFVWIKFHVGQNVILKPGETLTMHIFTDLAEEGLLIAPGTMFNVDESIILEREVAFRISFSSGTHTGYKVLITNDSKSKCPRVSRF
ncbi:hypothetical protein Clacol_001211 [Clathrus columnatus]|uniref:Aminotransferase class I/classII large domain-containing protein n=1 Tax=Clathrus columnatus TaxID=1419009 RepID=A0AAV5A1B0_9AGAM|nr:hypothetical protein Clacol_001211 [Clathrus columnatus]